MYTWEQLKLAIQTLYPQYVGNGKIVENDDDGLTPSALAILVDLVNNRIVSNPNEFEFLKETDTMTLDGSTSYDMGTLFPGFKSLFQNYGIDQNQSVFYFGNTEGNITPIDGYTMKGNSLIFTGTAPPSGEATVQYKSKYAVKDSAGDRQQFFLDDADYTVFDNPNLIIFGVGEFINWLSDTKEQDRKAEIHNWWNEALDDLILHGKQTNQLDNMY